MARRLLLPFVLALALSPAASASTQPQALELEVKAAFLFNFTKFVEWPADAYRRVDQPHTICVLGRDPFGRILDDVVAGEQVRSRPLAVRRITGQPEPGACQILFLSLSERGRYGDLLAQIDTTRVLTVSDDPAFLDAGGHVALFVEENRVRFAVNTAATERCEFQVSSRLLQVARPYTPRRQGR